MLTVRSLIFKCFKFLESEGYSVEIAHPHDQFSLEKLEVKYVNKAKKRKISIRYSKSKIEQDIQYLFSTSIIRIPYEDPTKDFFSLSTYFDSIGFDFPTTLTNRFDEKQAETILQKTAAFIQKNAGIFVNGTEWAEGYYPHWN